MTLKGSRWCPDEKRYLKPEEIAALAPARRRALEALGRRVASPAGIRDAGQPPLPFLPAPMPPPRAEGGLDLAGLADRKSVV